LDLAGHATRAGEGQIDDQDAGGQRATFGRAVSLHQIKSALRPCGLAGSIAVLLPCSKQSTQFPRTGGAWPLHNRHKPVATIERPKELQNNNVKQGGRYAAALCESPWRVDRRTASDGRRGNGGGGPEGDEALCLQLRGAEPR